MVGALRKFSPVSAGQFTVLLSACLMLVAYFSPTSARADDADKTLIITKAVYGDLPAGKQEDVTDKVKAMVKDNSLNCSVSNDNFDDPAQGTVKKLRVEYTMGGVAGAKIANEYETLTIAVGEQPPVIIKAMWGNLGDGANGGGTDVTDKVAAQVKAGERWIAASADTLGKPDAAGPIPAATPNRLRVEFTINGKKYTKTADLNISLNIAPSVEQSGDLIITKALYGQVPDGPAFDVTDLVAATIHDGAVILPVNDDSFGMGSTAPNDGPPKKLLVDYIIKGIKGEKILNADDSLMITTTAPATQTATPPKP
jgi:hypothetical protein